MHAHPLPQAERHFDHVNAVSHGMRNLLMLSTNKDCKDHKVIVMRAFNKMHDHLEKIRSKLATGF